jgi:hypothetical protein
VQNNDQLNNQSTDIPGEKIMATRASHVLVETLALHGVDRFFCVPGESYLGFMDALYDEPKIRGITCRHQRINRTVLSRPWRHAAGRYVRSSRP